MPANPISVSEDLREAYLRYIDTAFWLRDPRLIAERRRLLEQDGRLFTDPLLEPVVPHDAEVSLLDVCREVGISSETGDIVGRAWAILSAAFARLSFSLWSSAPKVSTAPPQSQHNQRI